MGLLDRPYAPTWKPNRTLYRHPPDAIVYVNGTASMEACPTCNRRLELQKYITSISVDTSTDPVSNATISLVVPKSDSGTFGSEGNWLLQPGLEVTILFRGYFPEKGLVEDYENEPLSDVSLYPYYQVFWGVVKDVSHEFSDGFYSASISCSDILHFWQYLYLSTNGAVFGPRPDNSGVFVDLSGHSLTRLSPVSIIYTLVRAGFGAAFGVEYKLSQKTNFNDTKGRAFKHAAEYWAARWEQRAGNLRMYGIDGSLFSMLEQAYLGVFQSGNANAVKNIVKSIGGKFDYNTRDINNSAGFQETLRKFGFNQAQTTASISVNAAGKITRTDMQAMMVYAMDLGTMGQANFFNSEMMSKLEIANAVTSLTGYEFYMDVNGDLVFKPPFYNLDTRQDPVYVIEDADLISISETSTEPEATMIKGTGSHFQNWKGTGTDDWMGVGSTYVDFRLVAQYGWREGGAFETTYLTDPRMIFIAAINRLDLANIGVNGASISIPLRPELRAGYPVYVRHLDCFYYAKSVSHSFAFGGQCTTSITGVARRRKWLPPVSPPQDGKLPQLKDIRLDEPGKFPQMPIFVKPENIGNGGEIGGQTRIIGFPNVILALDPAKIDQGTIPLAALANADLDKIVTANPGTLERRENGDYFLRTGSGSNDGRVYTRDELLSIFTGIRQELATPSVVTQTKNARNKQIAPLSAFDQNLVRCFQNSPLGTNSAIRADRELSSWVSLNVNLKALFAPGNELRGQYRYYSSSHSEEAFQGPETLVFQEDGTIAYDPATGDYVTENAVPMLTAADDGVGVQMQTPSRGVRIASLNDDSGLGFVNVQTGDVRQVSFAPHSNNLPTTREVTESGYESGNGLGITQAAIAQVVVGALAKSAAKVAPSIAILGRFTDGFDTVKQACDALYQALTGLAPDLASQIIQGPRSTPVADMGGVPFSVAVPAVLNLSGMLTANGYDGSKLVTDTFKNRDLPGVTAISTKLAGPLAKVMSLLLDTAKTMAVPAMYEAKAAFEAAIGLTSQAAVGVTKTKVSTGSGKKFYTPVFPVSDQYGYEVYGGMPYGRDMNITSSDDVFDGIETTARSENMAELERALVVLKARGYDAVNLYSGLNAQERAAVAAVGITEAGSAAVLADKIKASRGQVLARNVPVTTTDLFQTETGGAAVAAAVAGGASGADLCTCRGADSAFLMEAAGRMQELVTGADIQEWAQEQVLESGVTWAQAKEAMAGATLDRRFDYNQAKDKVDRVLSNAEARLNQVGPRIQRANTALKDGLK